MKFFVLLALLSFVFPAHAATYDLPYVGDQIEYDAEYEDTFVHIARDYKLGYTEMRAANPYVDPWIPGDGTDLILPTRHLLPDAPREGIVINLPEMRLYYFPPDGSAPQTFPIGVGRDGLNTPVGETKVIRKTEGPIWRPTPRMRKEDPELKAEYFPGPDNPLGTHALYLGWPTYAIHGTNKPFGIGRRVSSGCIRMYPEDIITLFGLVEPGTKVTVVNQPVKAAWIDNKLYIEAHPDIEQSVEVEEYGVAQTPKLNDEDLKHIIKVAGADEDRLRWPAIRKVIQERKGFPVYVARRSSRDGTDEALDDELDSAEAKAQAKEEEKRVAQKARQIIESYAAEKEGGASDQEDSAQPRPASHEAVDGRTASYSIKNKTLNP